VASADAAIAAAVIAGAGPPARRSTRTRWAHRPTPWVALARAAANPGIAWSRRRRKNHGSDAANWLTRHTSRSSGAASGRGAA
jgi:hypothetical protein